MMTDIPVEKAARSMLEAAAFFYQQGWLLGTCGNLSVKVQQLPERILITPSGVDKSQLQLQDFLLVDGQGVNHGPVQGKASEELAVHQRIYQLTSARAVYHVHSVPNNLASHLWREQSSVSLEGIEMIKGIAGKTLQDEVCLPIACNHQSMPDLAESVAAALRPGVPAVLVYQHGIYAWGDQPDAARRHVEIFEFLLDYVVRRSQLR